MITQSQELNENLIEAVKKKLPRGINIANFLMGALCIGREAAYRRLRGEVPFTLSESAVICRQLEISLDALVRSDTNNIAVVNFYSAKPRNDIETYKAMLEAQIRVFDLVAKDPFSELHLACNRLSLIDTLRYEHIAKFTLFKWLYQKGALAHGLRYNSFEVPEELSRLHRKYTSAAGNINSGSCLWDTMILDYMFRDLRYFHNVNLLDREGLALIKQDILTLLDKAESAAMRGHTSAGKGQQFYISNINFDSPYGYIAGNGVHQSIMKISGPNLMTSTDVGLFERTKEWVESLRKFSILISQSGEMQRITFFNRQRENLESLRMDSE